MAKLSLAQAIQIALTRCVGNETARVYTLEAPPLDALFGKTDKITSIEDVVICNSSSPKKYGESLNRHKRRK